MQTEVITKKKVKSKPGKFREGSSKKKTKAIDSIILILE
jgi:hypothetical protein